MGGRLPLRSTGGVPWVDCYATMMATQHDPALFFSLTRERQMLPERRTVGALLAHLAQAIPQQEAVVLPPRRLTYAALYAQATGVAGGLWRLGIRPGEPVALLMSNRPEWIMTALGCALIGAPVVALSTWSRRVELEYVLDHSQAVALVTLDGFLGRIFPLALSRPLHVTLWDH